jgi:phospholipid/cholesterol/gamma-HCH transport system permease protein
MNTPSAVLGWFRAWGRAGRFTVLGVAAVLSPSSYTSFSRSVSVKQVYFTAYQVVPAYVFFAALLGLVVADITVAVARSFGLAHYALELIFRALVLEVAPMLTALFVALRSGAAISTEVALMQVAGELDQMRSRNLDPFEREFVPRILGVAFAMVSLTIIGSVVMLLLSYIAMYGFLPWGFDAYTRTIALVFNIPALVGFSIKWFAFGLMVAMIPIAAGLDATRDAKSAPVAVMGGMVRLFSALGLIEITSLAVKYG